jgi:ribosomal protein S18 acetylase RimI-like enzyme
VAIIGHSLGGIYARELACRFRNLVARVILLGSPVRDPLKSPNRVLRPFFAWWHRRCASSYATSTGGEEVAPSTDPPRVPETLIYSKNDGVVQWQNCIESGPQVEAIEVRSSHCGLPYCAEVSEIIIRLEVPAAHIYGMWVAPAQRRRGNGIALMNAGLLWARTKEADRAELWVAEGNTAATRLYEGLGFHDTGMREAIRAGSAIRIRQMILKLADNRI